MGNVVILGAGDFARELAWLADILDPVFAADWGDDILKLSAVPKGTEFLLGVGSPVSREDMFNRAIERGLKPATLICEGATIAWDAKIGEGSIIMPGAVVSVGVRLGRGCLMNFNSVAGHDCQLGDFTVLDPGAKVGGRAVLGSVCEVGTNASVLPKINVGDRTTIGIGSTAIRDTPGGLLVMGVPGRAIKR